jgi:hypothetical protein
VTYANCVSLLTSSWADNLCAIRLLLLRHSRYKFLSGPNYTIAPVSMPKRLQWAGAADGVLWMGDSTPCSQLIMVLSFFL